MAFAPEARAANSHAQPTDSDPFAPTEQSAPASEPEPVDPPPRTAGLIALGGGFRYGIATNDPEVDPWRSGLGLSVGYTTYDALYFGGVFDWFFGETRNVLGEEVSAHVWQIGGEVGYDRMLGNAVMVRPKVGAGVSTANVECELCEIAGSDTYFGVAPGVAAQIYAGPVTLGLDARYQIVFADPETIQALILSLGVGF